MQSLALSVALSGLEAHLIRVEVDSGRGLPTFHIVGLPETAVRESRMRVRAALAQLGVELNEYVLTVNLAPADLRKSGSSFDLAIAVATLGALGRVPLEPLARVLLLGELALSGEVRPVRGVLPALLAAAAAGHEVAIVPADNAAEAAAIQRIRCYRASTLRQVVEHLSGRGALELAARGDVAASIGEPAMLVDLAEVRGQQAARGLLEIAAAGGHNLLMMGPPGAGKTMLARRLPTILPAMTLEESLEVTAVHSVAGLLGRDHGLLRERPFRAPHHTVSAAGLLGGGDPLRPGEVSLAHHGTLFLDELGEFQRHVLEGLRQPLESGSITVCRARARTTFPARPLLVAAVNPCPCGHSGDPLGRCRCSPERIRAYRGRMSGPLLDRIDLHLVLPPVTLEQLHSTGSGESAAQVRARVLAARALQAERRRQGITSAPLNAELQGKDLDRVAVPDAAATALLRTAVDCLGLSARGYTKVRRVARTIADLEGSDGVRAGHFAGALQCRSLERPLGEPADLAA